MRKQIVGDEKDIERREAAEYSSERASERPAGTRDRRAYVPEYFVAGRVTNGQRY